METTEQKISIGRIVRTNEIESALPLEHTEVTAQLNGPVASVTVAQRFGNPLSEAAELEYLFPLPAGAAVTGFSLRLGKREIRGELEEIEKARADYADARDQGRQGGMLEQRRPNLFAVQIANILPGETILAEMRYQERVKFDADGYEFVFPMGITPKYDRPGHPEESKGVHAPVARPGEAVGLLDLTIAADTGVPCGEPVSPSHPLDVRRLDERRLQVRLAGEHIPDHDFVLRLPVAGEAPSAAGWSSSAKDGAYFLATILPPRSSIEAAAEPREFIFVLDRSGSMGGEPILQARNALRACIRTLNPEDTFHVLLFDDQLEWYRPEPCAVTQAEVDQADAFLSQVDARGGTEIIAALEAALGLADDPRRTRFVVFLTDGAVSAEISALEMLRRKLGTARIFTFGIGPSVNRALLSRMAREGRGASEFLQADEDIEGAVIRFQDRVSFPALTDLSLSWRGAKAWDLYPQRLPDLYIGQPLELCGRFLSKGGTARLTVRGKRAGADFEAELLLRQNEQADPAVGRVWAQARAEALLEEMELEPRRSDELRAAVIALALEHSLVTAYTAFAALDESIVNPGGKPARVKVAQPLPQGLNFGGFVPGPPVAMMAAMPVRGGALMRGMGKNRTFMAKHSIHIAESQGVGEDGMAFMMTAPPQAPEPELLAGGQIRYPAGEEALRELARTQRLDGSWNGSVEHTAAAVLAFVRAGHTTTAGSFRRVARRAVRWLEANTGDGFASWARARALRELAETSGDAPLRALAQAAENGLAAPLTALEKAAASGLAPAGFTRAEDMDGLRLAGFLALKVEVEIKMVSDPLARAWAALVK